MTEKATTIKTSNIIFVPIGGRNVHFFGDSDSFPFCYWNGNLYVSYGHHPDLFSGMKQMGLGNILDATKQGEAVWGWYDYGRVSFGSGNLNTDVDSPITREAEIYIKDHLSEILSYFNRPSLSGYEQQREAAFLAQQMLKSPWKVATRDWIRPIDQADKRDYLPFTGRQSMAYALIGNQLYVAPDKYHGAVFHYLKEDLGLSTQQLSQGLWGYYNPDKGVFEHSDWMPGNNYHQIDIEQYLPTAINVVTGEPLNKISSNWDDIEGLTDPSTQPDYWDDDNRAWSQENKGDFMNDAIPYVLLDGQLYLGGDAHVELLSALKSKGYTLDQLKQGLWGWYDPDTKELFTHTDFAFGTNWHNEDAIRDALPNAIRVAGTQPVEVMVSSGYRNDYLRNLNDGDRSRLAWCYQDGTLYIGGFHKDIMREMRMEGLNPRENAMYGWIDPLNDNQEWSTITDFGVQDESLMPQVNAFFQRYPASAIMNYARTGLLQPPLYSKTARMHWESSGFYFPDEPPADRIWIGSPGEGHTGVLDNYDMRPKDLIGKNFVPFQVLYDDSLQLWVVQTGSDWVNGGTWDWPDGSFEQVREELADQYHLDPWTIVDEDQYEKMYRNWQSKFADSTNEDAFVYDPDTDKLYVGPFHRNIIVNNKLNYKAYDTSEPDAFGLRGFTSPLVLGIYNPLWVDEPQLLSDYGNSSATPEQQERALDLANEHYLGIVPAPLNRQTKWKIIAQNDYVYHVAPTKDRSRILTHGLQPSYPALNGWAWGRSEDEFVDGLRNQPTGIYTETTPYGRFWAPKNEPTDIWRIPKKDIDWRNVARDNYSSGPVIQHPIYTMELHEPWEDTQSFPNEQEMKGLDKRTPWSNPEIAWKYQLGFPADILPERYQLGQPTASKWKTADYPGELAWIYDHGNVLIGNDHRELMDKNKLNDQLAYGYVDGDDVILMDNYSGEPDDVVLNAAQQQLKVAYRVSIRDTRQAGLPVGRAVVYDPKTGQIYFGNFHRAIARNNGLNLNQCVAAVWSNDPAYDVVYRNSKLNLSSADYDHILAEIRQQLDQKTANRWPYLAFGYVDHKLWTDKHGHPFIMYNMIDNKFNGNKDAWRQWIGSVPQAWGLAFDGHVEWYSDSAEVGDSNSMIDAVVALKEKGYISPDTDEFGEINKTAAILPDKPWNDPAWLRQEQGDEYGYGDHTEIENPYIPFLVLEDGRYWIGWDAHSHAYDWMMEDAEKELNIDYYDMKDSQGSVNFAGNEYEVHWPNHDLHRELESQIVQEIVNDVEDSRRETWERSQLNRTAAGFVNNDLTAPYGWWTSWLYLSSGQDDGLLLATTEQSVNHGELLRNNGLSPRIVREEGMMIIPGLLVDNYEADNGKPEGEDSPDAIMPLYSDEFRYDEVIDPELVPKAMAAIQEFCREHWGDLPIVNPSSTLDDDQLNTNDLIQHNSSWDDIPEGYEPHCPECEAPMVSRYKETMGWVGACGDCELTFGLPLAKDRVAAQMKIIEDESVNGVLRHYTWVYDPNKNVLVVGKDYHAKLIKRNLWSIEPDDRKYEDLIAGVYDPSYPELNTQYYPEYHGEVPHNILTALNEWAANTKTAGIQYVDTDESGHGGMNGDDTYTCIYVPEEHMLYVNTTPSSSHRNLFKYIKQELHDEYGDDWVDKTDQYKWGWGWIYWDGTYNQLDRTVIPDELMQEAAAKLKSRLAPYESAWKLNTREAAPHGTGVKAFAYIDGKLYVDTGHPFIIEDMIQQFEGNLYQERKQAWRDWINSRPSAWGLTMNGQVEWFSDTMSTGGEDEDMMMEAVDALKRRGLVSPEADDLGSLTTTGQNTPQTTREAAVTYHYDSVRSIVRAYDGNREVGYMEIASGPIIHFIKVLPRYRRQGIATGMLHAYEQETGLTLDFGNPANRTKDGEEWIRSFDSLTPIVQSKFMHMDRGLTTPKLLPILSTSVQPDIAYHITDHLSSAWIQGASTSDLVSQAPSRYDNPDQIVVGNEWEQFMPRLCNNLPPIKNGSTKPRSVGQSLGKPTDIVTQSDWLLNDHVYRTPAPVHASKVHPHQGCPPRVPPDIKGKAIFATEGTLDFSSITANSLVFDRGIKDSLTAKVVSIQKNSITQLIGGHNAFVYINGDFRIGYAHASLIRELKNEGIDPRQGVYGWYDDLTKYASIVSWGHNKYQNKVMYDQVAKLLEQQGFTVEVGEWDFSNQSESEESAIESKHSVPESATREARDSSDMSLWQMLSDNVPPDLLSVHTAAVKITDVVKVPSPQQYQGTQYADEPFIFDLDSGILYLSIGPSYHRVLKNSCPGGTYPEHAAYGEITDMNPWTDLPLGKKGIALFREGALSMNEPLFEEVKRVVGNYFKLPVWSDEEFDTRQTKKYAKEALAWIYVDGTLYWGATHTRIMMEWADDEHQDFRTIMQELQKDPHVMGWVDWTAGGPQIETFSDYEVDGFNTYPELEDEALNAINAYLDNRTAQINPEDLVDKDANVMAFIYDNETHTLTTNLDIGSAFFHPSMIKVMGIRDQINERPQDFAFGWAEKDPRGVWNYDMTTWEEDQSQDSGVQKNALEAFLARFPGSIQRPVGGAFTLTHTASQTGWHIQYVPPEEAVDPYWEMWGNDRWAFVADTMNRIVLIAPGAFHRPLLRMFKLRFDHAQDLNRSPISSERFIGGQWYNGTVSIYDNTNPLVAEVKEVVDEWIDNVHNGMGTDQATKIAVVEPTRVSWIGNPTHTSAIWVWHIPSNHLIFGNMFETYHRTIMREMEPNLGMKESLGKFLLGEIDDVGGTPEVSNRDGTPYQNPEVATAVINAWRQNKQAKLAWGQGEWFHSWFYFPQKGGLIIDTKKNSNHRQLLQANGLQIKNLLESPYNVFAAGQLWMNPDEKIGQIEIASDLLQHDGIDDDGTSGGAEFNPDPMRQIVFDAVGYIAKWFKEHYPDWSLYNQLGYKIAKIASVQWLESNPLRQKNFGHWISFVSIDGNLYLSHTLIHPQILKQIGMKPQDLRAAHTAAGWIHTGANIGGFYLFDEEDLNGDDIGPIKAQLEAQFPGITFMDQEDFLNHATEWDQELPEDKTSRYFKFVPELEADSRWGGLPFIITPEDHLVVSDDPEEHHRQLAQRVGLRSSDIATAGVIYPNGTYTLLWGDPRLQSIDPETREELLEELPESVWDEGYNLDFVDPFKDIEGDDHPFHQGASYRELSTDPFIDGHQLGAFVYFDGQLYWSDTIHPRIIGMIMDQLGIRKDVSLKDFVQENADKLAFGRVFWHGEYLGFPNMEYWDDPSQVSFISLDYGYSSPEAKQDAIRLLHRIDPDMTVNSREGY